mgnify:CR=1 FL=1
MHHAPCTVHHRPCTTDHTPYTMHHTPCTMHHAPCTMHHTPCARATAPAPLPPVPSLPTNQTRRTSGSSATAASRSAHILDTSYAANACARGGCAYAIPTHRSPSALATAATRFASATESASLICATVVAVARCGGSYTTSTWVRQLSNSAGHDRAAPQAGRSLDHAAQSQQPDSTAESRNRIPQPNPAAQHRDGV